MFLRGFMRTFDDETYKKRQLELSNRMIEQKIDLFFCPPSADLEYLTGTFRRKPTFGNISYRHGWVCGAFLGHSRILYLYFQEWWQNLICQMELQEKK